MERQASGMTRARGGCEKDKINRTRKVVTSNADFSFKLVTLKFTHSRNYRGKILHLFLKYTPHLFSKLLLLPSNNMFCFM